MNISNLKIGYVPQSSDLTSPGDRRRFVHFAKSFSINFEVASENNIYDIVFLTPHNDLAHWISYKKRNPHVKLIFEMTDTLIYSNDLIRDLFKGTGRYLLGKSSKLYLNYKDPIIESIKLADAVVCSSNQIKNIISSWNSNIHVSLDYFQDEIKTSKINFASNKKLKLVWDGQGAVLENFLYYKEVFQQINSFCELHIITDEYYYKFGRLFKTPITRLLEKLPIDTIFYKWEKYKSYEIMMECDCGIIPLNPNNKMAWHKPANKLISYWFCGLPTLTSNTPAYAEIMGEAGIEGVCHNKEEWVRKIYNFKNLNYMQRESLAIKGQDFVKQNYSDKALHKNWEILFGSIL